MLLKGKIFMNICNFAMDRLLTSVYQKGVTPCDGPKIWEKKTLDGNPFWGIGNFCGLPVDEVTQYGKDLTNLEWEGNELFFSHEDQESLKMEVIASYLALKKQMEEKLLDRVFDLVVSIDEKNHTGTIRFYGIRDRYHYIEPTQENLERFKQEAVLIETVNENHLEKYLPFLSEQLDHTQIEIENVEKNEIRIQSIASESSMDLCWDDEFTLYFADFHCHYGEEEWETLIGDMKKIMTGRLMAGRVESGGRWLGSYLLEPENIPVTSKSRLLKYLFGGQKDFYKEVQQNGGIFSITAWDVKKNRTYLIKENGIEAAEESG